MQTNDGISVLTTQLRTLENHGDVLCEGFGNDSCRTSGEEGIILHSPYVDTKLFMATSSSHLNWKADREGLRIFQKLSESKHKNSLRN